MRFLGWVVSIKRKENRHSNAQESTSLADRDKEPTNTQHTGNRVVVFIDGSNLYHGLEENCKRFDLNFGAFASKLCGGRRLVRIYYYNILQDQERTPQAYQDQQGFLFVLHNTPLLEVRLGISKIRGDTLVEKGVDIMIATDLLEFGRANMFDTAVLVSGDADFVYALQAVKNMGKHVEVAAFPNNLSPELARNADDRHILNPTFFRPLWRGHARRRPIRRGSRRTSQPTLAPSEKHSPEQRSRDATATKSQLPPGGEINRTHR